MRPLRRWAAWVLPAALVLPGCSALPLPHQAEPTPVVTELVIDVSDSMNDPAVTARLLADVERVAQQTARRGGVLLGDLVTSNPTTDSATPIYQDFKSSEEIKGNPVYEDPERARRVAAAIAQVKAVLATDQPERTDLLTACLVAQRVLARYSSATRWELVIFSDMLQNAGGHNFYKAKLDDQHVRAILDRLRAGRLLPDLSGVHVYAAGAGIVPEGADPKRQVSDSQNLAVARFWAAYFEAAGADLAPGHYAARLLAFP